MNDTIPPDGAAERPWPTGDHLVRLADPSTLPGSGTAAPEVAGLLRQAAQGAHDSIDHPADRAVPATQRLAERASAAGDAMQAKSDQLRDIRDIRDIRDELADSARTAVRNNPLASVAAALALGAVIARIAR